MGLVSINSGIIKTFYIRNIYLYLRIILDFLVKIFMLMVHLWLSKAHVKATSSTYIP